MPAGQGVTQGFEGLFSFQAGDQVPEAAPGDGAGAEAGVADFAPQAGEAQSDFPRAGGEQARPFRAARPAADHGLCIAAIRRAERRYQIPENLLMAIGLQEAGMQKSGILTVWPWTANVEGAGYRFASRNEAEAFVRQKLATGVTSIDIGCMQINLKWHPMAFSSLREGFYPAANVDYAARLLLSLKESTGSWLEAAGRYHSATETYKTKYQQGIERNLVVASRRAAEFDAILAELAFDAESGGWGAQGFGRADAAAPRVQRFKPLQVPASKRLKPGQRRFAAPQDGRAAVDSAGTGAHMTADAEGRADAEGSADQQAIAPLLGEENRGAMWWSEQIGADGAALATIYGDQDIEPVLPEFTSVSPDDAAAIFR